VIPKTKGREKVIWREEVLMRGPGKELVGGRTGKGHKGQSAPVPPVSVKQKRSRKVKQGSCVVTPC